MTQQHALTPADATGKASRTFSPALDVIPEQVTLVLDGKTLLLDQLGLSIEGWLDGASREDSVHIVIGFVEGGDERYHRVIVDGRLEVIIGRVPRSSQSALLGRYTHGARITFQ